MGRLSACLEDRDRKTTDTFRMKKL